MAIIDELRTPLYFAAGTADLAVQQARRIAAEAPARIDAVRNTDPKAVQEKVTTQAKEAQATLQTKFSEIVGGLDTDLKKLGETAQGLALRSVGVAAEYAVKAREAYEKVAEHGEQTVKTWRGEAAEEITEIAVAVEPEPAPRTGEKKAEQEKGGEEKADGGPAAGKTATAGASAKPAAKKAPARKPAARKATPSGEK
ncbi:hypothetical protein [Streptomyces sp. TRM49041]|uniref:hypothetical protein n=1 Tax=Streptomyces sp. TRM49041 TaxID=2603216 RepID=UPI0011EE9D13|nr:hypothetical protein [Streptomyces sp. TRM49041]